MQDVDVSDNKLHMCDRGPLENGAEIKTVHSPRSSDVSADLIDEMVASVGHVHTAEVERNRLFMTGCGERAGQAMTDAAVDSLFRRLPQKTGITPVTPHVLWHAMLTKRAEPGWQPELLQKGLAMRHFSKPTRPMCILPKRYDGRHGPRDAQ